MSARREAARAAQAPKPDAPLAETAAAAKTEAARAIAAARRSAAGAPDPAAAAGKLRATAENITVLKTLAKIPLTKTWCADGTIRPYDQAKRYTTAAVARSSIQGLANLLEQLAVEPDCCIIRGALAPDAVPERPGLYLRNTRNFREQARRFVMFDIDGYLPDGIDSVRTPQAAVEQFISRRLPECFHGITYYWRLSASAGHPSAGGKLKAHLWYWLENPYTEGQLTAWKHGLGIEVDVVTFRTVQIHYTADPVFEAGVVDPVAVRGGLVDGFCGDEVPLVIPPGLLAAARERIEGEDRNLVDPKEKPGLIGAFCRAFPIEDVMEQWLADVFEFESISDGRRLNFLQGNGAKGGAFITPDREYISNTHNTDPLRGRATNKWDLVRHYKFGHLDDPDDAFDADATKSASNEAMRAWVATLPEVQAELKKAKVLDAEAALSAVDLFRARIAAADVCTIDIDIVPEIKAAGLDSGPRDTLADVISKRLKALNNPRSMPTIKKALAPPSARLHGADHVDLSRAGAPASLGMSGFPHMSITEKGPSLKTTVENIEHLLQGYGITVYYDVIKKKPVIVVPSLATTPDQADNAAISTVVSLAAVNDIKTPSLVAEFVGTVAFRAPRNVIADWIKSKRWDGQDRISELLNTLVPRDGFPISLRDKLVCRWLISAVAAALKPSGFHSKGVLTLQGAQSLGKSAWFERLLPGDLSQQYILSGAHLDPANKDSMITALSHWLVELGEVDSTMKRDIPAVKAFISKGADKLRPPYARTDAEFQRRTVFCASVNPEAYLPDETGNVRWWTIPVAEVRYRHTIDMQQLWAQVAVRYEAGERWWLESAEEELLEQNNAHHQQRSAIYDTLASSMNLESDRATWHRLSASEVLHAIGYGTPTNPQAKDCGSALRALLGEPTKAKGRAVWLVPPIQRSFVSVGSTASSSAGPVPQPVVDEENFIGDFE
ncbi:VapE domain-containing protein [Aromatoleum buckelii]|uniref:Virulence-associated protein E-like domain-containing protein n=1 Tax=Aromatoleum buckelii TaxID=200254 RepID=A0ABX1N6D8_9RHOO|nr:VapE domain-containing protein [Aromatoleum buckelii]MCK0511940.1 virulence-associated E family protein [Aromatoleum buckelii]